MKQIRCFMIGHRDTPAEIYSHLQYEVERHITQFGVTEFIVGHYGNFDCLAAKAIRAAKQKYPHIILSLLLPYHPCESFVEDQNNFDTLFYPEGMETVPRRYAIPTANRYAIQYADYLIAFVQHPASNSEKLVRYAHSLEKKGVLKITMLMYTDPKSI